MSALIIRTCSSCNAQVDDWHAPGGKVFCFPCWGKDGTPLKGGDESSFGGQVGSWITVDTSDWHNEDGR